MWSKLARRQGEESNSLIANSMLSMNNSYSTLKTKDSSKMTTRQDRSLGPPLQSVRLKSHLNTVRNQQEIFKMSSVKCRDPALNDTDVSIGDAGLAQACVSVQSSRKRHKIRVPTIRGQMSPVMKQNEQDDSFQGAKDFSTTS